MCFLAQVVTRKSEATDKGLDLSFFLAGIRELGVLERVSGAQI